VAISALTFIDSAGVGSSTLLTLTVPAGGVPAGALVIIRVHYVGSTFRPDADISDSRGNSYTTHINQSHSGNTRLRIATGVITTALQPGDTITLDHGNSGSGSISTMVARAHYVTGADLSPGRIVDSSSAGSTSTSPSSGSVQPTATGQLVIGAIGHQNTASVTGDSDTVDGSWSTYGSSGQASGSARSVVGGQEKIVTGLSAQTYNVSLDTSRLWSAGAIVIRDNVVAKGKVVLGARARARTDAPWFRSFAGETTGVAPADTTLRADTGATWTVETDGSSLDNRVIVNDRSSQSTWKILSFDGAGSPSGVVEALILTRFGGSTGSPRTGVIIHGSGAADSQSGYMAYLDNSATQSRLRLGRWDNGSLTALANAASFSFNGGNDLFYIRIQHNGTAIRAKWWRAQDNEPGSWTISSNDTTYSSGWIAYANTQVSTSQAIRLDAIGVGTSGDPAPMLLPTITPDPVAVDAEQIDITFNEVPHANAEHDLRWSTDNATWTTLTDVDSPYEHTDLTPSTTYYYQARVRLGAFTGDWSGSASATTTGGGPPAVGLEAKAGLILGARAAMRVPRSLDNHSGLILGARARVHIRQLLALEAGIVLGARAQARSIAEHSLDARNGILLGARARMSLVRDLESRGGLLFGGRAAAKVKLPSLDSRAGILLGARARIALSKALEARNGALLGARAAARSIPIHSLESLSGVLLGARAQVSVFGTKRLSLSAGTLLGARAQVRAIAEESTRAGIVFGGRAAAHVEEVWPEGVYVKRGFFTKKTDGTGLQSLDDIGFRPKALWIHSICLPESGNSLLGNVFNVYGISSGPGESYCATTAGQHGVSGGGRSYYRRQRDSLFAAINVNGDILAECDVASFDEFGFTLNWETNDNSIPYIIEYIAFGGDMEATTGTWNSSNSPVVDSVGFEPSFISFIWTGSPETSSSGANHGIGFFYNEPGSVARSNISISSRTRITTEESPAPGGGSIHSVDHSIDLFTGDGPSYGRLSAAVESVNADGFVLDVTSSEPGVTIPYLAISKVRAYMRNFGRNATGVNNISGIPFKPGVLLFASSHIQFTGGAIQPSSAASSIGLASLPITRQRVMATRIGQPEQWDADTYGNRAQQQGIIYAAPTDDGIIRQSSLTSIGDNGFTVSSSTSSGPTIQVQILWVAFEHVPPPPRQMLRTFDNEATGQPPAGMTERWSESTWNVVDDGSRRGIANDASSISDRNFISLDTFGRPDDAEVSVLQYFSGQDDGPQSGVVLRGRVINGQRVGYFARINWESWESRLVIGKYIPEAFVGANTQVLLTQTPISSFTAGVGPHYIRFRAEGATLRAKWWSAYAPEPDFWHLEATDIDYQNGFVGYHNLQGSEPIYLDAVGVGTYGLNAPVIRSFRPRSGIMLAGAAAITPPPRTRGSLILGARALMYATSNWARVAEEIDYTFVNHYVPDIDYAIVDHQYDFGIDYEYDLDLIAQVLIEYQFALRYGERYIGPGSGFLTDGDVPLLDRLREGDRFPTLFSQAGVAGLSGVSHVLSRTIRSDMNEQELSVQPVFPDDPRVIAALQRGQPPVVRPPEEQSMARQVRRERRQREAEDRRRRRRERQ